MFVCLLFLCQSTQVLRSAKGKALTKITAINDPFIDPTYMRYMFAYDTVHGVYKGTVENDDKHLIVDGHKIRIFNEMDPSKIKWYVQSSVSLIMNIIMLPSLHAFIVSRSLSLSQSTGEMPVLTM